MILQKNKKNNMKDSSYFMFFLFFFLLIFCLLTIPSIVLSTIESITPTNNTFLNTRNVTLEFYVNINHLKSCDLIINNRTITYNEVNNGLNSLGITNIDEGEYYWSIKCINQTIEEESEKKLFIIDIQEPNIIIENNNLINDSFFSFSVNDDNLLDNCSLFIRKNNTIFFQKNYNNISKNNFSVREKAILNQNNYTESIICFDKAGNKAIASKDIAFLQRPFFYINTDKKEYYPLETILLEINTIPEANVSIDICPEEEGFVQCISPLINQNQYPQTITLPKINKTGNYVIEGYAETSNGLLINKSTFTILNSLKAYLTSTAPELNKTTTLKVNVEGSVGKINYEWHLSNGSIIRVNNSDNNFNEVNIIYKRPGTYKEEVFITDSAGNKINKSIINIVNEKLTVKLIVYNNKSKELINNALITISGFDKGLNTIGGFAEAYLNKKSYLIGVSAPGFKDYYERINVKDNKTTFRFYLEPEQGIIINNENVTMINNGTNSFVKTKIYFTTTLSSGTCSLLVQKNTNEFITEQRISIDNNINKNLVFSTMITPPFNYIISCSYNNNLLSTTVRTINNSIINQNNNINQESNIKQENNKEIGEKNNLNIGNNETQKENFELDNKYDKYKNYFEDVLNYIDSLNSEEQKLINILKLRKKLLYAKKRAGQIGRDIFNLEKNSPVDKEEKINNLKNELNALIKETPVSLEIIDKKIISNYPSAKEIKLLNKKYNLFPKEIEDLVIKEQQNYTITIRVYHLRILYADEHKEIITLINKKLFFGKEKKSSWTNHKIIEVLPEDYDPIILNDNNRLKKNIFETKELSEINYYFNKEIAFSELSKARTIVVPTKAVINNKITGFSIAGLGFLNDISNNLGLSLTSLILIIIILYLAYYFNLFDHIRFLFFESGKKERVHYLNVLINDAIDNLESNNFDKALLLYKEIGLTYDTLNDLEKNEVYDSIKELRDKINYFYLQKEIDIMKKEVENNEFEKAINTFKKIEGTFKMLNEEDKKRVIDIVMLLGKKVGLK